MGKRDGLDLGKVFHDSSHMKCRYGFVDVKARKNHHECPSAMARIRKIISYSFSVSPSESITPKRLTEGLSLAIPNMLSKSRSGSLPAWQCWFPAKLVNVNETDAHSTVVRGCSGMSWRKVHC